MAITLDGTNGISTPDVEPTGSTVPTNGLYLPAANSVGIATNSTNAVYINSSQNVGIGTSSPRAKLSVTNGTENTSGDAPQEAIITGANQTIISGLGILTVQSNTAIGADVGATIALGGRIRNTGLTTDASNFAVLKGAKENATSDNSAGYFAISTKPNAAAPVERMRIDSSGNLLVGTTSTLGTAKVTIKTPDGSGSQIPLTLAVGIVSDGFGGVSFRNPNGAQGGITINSTTVSYNTTSDYRLKENVQPMIGALATVAQLKPCTYIWKANGSAGQGFIAHELQAVVPDCVTGEKDAIDEEGKPQYQGIDTSFLVATLTAAIKEQQAIIEQLTTRIEALEQQP